jgi:hypothetical protein
MRKNVLMAKSSEVEAQIAANRPAIKSGQIGTITKGYSVREYPREIRVVCLYPFAAPEDGRIWIVEDTDSISRLYRTPEMTLRLVYALTKKEA